MKQTEGKDQEAGLRSAQGG